MAVIKSLLRVVAVVALTVSASTMAAIDTRQVPLLKRHVQRILSTQADDQAACDAAYENNTIAKQFLSDLPTDAGLRNCIASNFNPLLTALSASSTCTLTTIVSLAGGSSTGLDTFLEFFTALIGGGSTDLTTVLASWTSSTSTKNTAFCDAMNTQIGPCVETLLPVLVKILDDKGACCSQLADLYEVAKLVIPDGDTLDQALVPVVNGLHQTMCTSVGDTLCGQPLLTYVSNVVAKTQDTTLLGPLLFDAGLTLFALPDGDKACTAMDSTTFASRVSAKGGAVTSINLSCCASGFASLLKSFDALIAHLTGDTLATTLNLIAGLQDSTTQFKDPYSAFSYCMFKKTCTAPSFLLTAGSGSLNVTANSPKNASPKKIKCTSTKLCDQDETCSNVCKEGTVTVAPWVKRAISYQRNLSYEQSLCFTQLPATHNSGTTLARGWGNRDQLTNKILDASNANSYLQTNNQFLTLTDQLNLGARLVELDVHYFAKKLRDGHCSTINFDILKDISKAIKRTTQTLLSAGSTTDVVVEWEPSLMGCLPSLGGIKAENHRLHADTVNEVAAWVKANPKELVIVYLDVGGEVTDYNQYDNMEALYTSAFGSLLYSPADLKAAGGSWKSFTLSSLVSQGKRVILIANSGDSVVFDKSKLCDGWSDIPSGNATGAATGTLWGKKLNAGGIVRAYSSLIHYATMSEEDLDGGSAKGTAAEPATVTAATLPVFVNAGVNLLAVDGLDGAVIEAMVWSWAANEPSRGDTAVEVSAKDGRWYGVVDKSSIANVACVSSSDRLSWELVAQGSSCPSGFTFGAPQRAVENTAMVAVLKAKGAEATAQLNVDLTKIPVITAAEEAAWATTDSPTTAPGSSGGGGGGSASASALYTMAMTVASVGFVLTLVL